MTGFDQCARDFIAASFTILRADHVIPTSSWRPRLESRLDFNALPIENLPEYARLTAAVVGAQPPGLPTAEQGHGFEASTLVFTFLEQCLYRCSRTGTYEPDGAEVTAAITRFAAVLAGEPYDVVVARHVSHLVPASGDEITVGEVTIIAEENTDLPVRIRREIPDADSAWKHHAPNPYRPPHALLITRGQANGVSYHGHGALTDILDKFQLSACLLTGANIQSMYQVSGVSSPISARPARFEQLARDTDVTPVRRTARLTEAHGPALSALSSLLDDVEAATRSKDIWVSSLGQAVEKFASFDDTADYAEQVVSLATALEGVMLGVDEKEALTLRLCTRVSAVLAGDDEPATTLFADLKRLYGLRSLIVHGGEVTLKRLNRDLAAMDCVPDDPAVGSILVRLGFAVDRLRDIVRRALLARICLATGDPAPWPFRSSINIDQVLADDTQRATWRAHWRDMLDSLGAGDAAARAPGPVAWSSPEDQ